MAERKFKVVVQKPPVAQGTNAAYEMERDALDPIGAEIVEVDAGSEEAFLAEAKDAAALIARNRRINATIIECLERCKVIGLNSVGADTVDVDAATRCGIVVTNVPDVFIDEVAEVPIEVQVKLLRGLQERTVERVGGNAPIKVDVRLISATHQNLDELVASGRFREDLYYRLNVVSIQVPPLRQRRRDVPLLVDHFLQRYGSENGKEIREVSREVMDLLMRHPYPGNVRELQNVVERAVVLARSDVITQADLPAEIRDLAGTAAVVDESASLPDQVEALERRAIDGALRQAQGVQSRAAEVLGITERNLRYKLKKYGFK